MTWWKCSKCGYTFEAEKPPEKCPNCGEICTFYDVTCYTPECGCEGYDPKFGARPLASIIQTRIKDKLTDEILFGKLEKGGKIFIGLRNNKLNFTFKS